MVSILLTLNAIICVALIILILLQRSDTSSGGMFGGAGSGSQAIIRNPLAKPTAILSALFLAFSIIAAMLNNGAGQAPTVMSTVPAPAAVPSLPEAALLGAATSPTAVPVNVTPTTVPTSK